MKLDIEVATKMELEFLKEIEVPLETVKERLKNAIREILEFEILDSNTIGTIEVEINKFDATE